MEQDETGRLATVRMTNPLDGDIVSDLLFASCGIEPEIVAAAVPMQVTDELRLPVASVGHLIAMKLLARDDRQRPTDADDLRELRRVATDADWSVASAAVSAIQERGFNRGRDLTPLLRALRSDDAY